MLQRLKYDFFAVTLPEVHYNVDTQAISVNEEVRKPLELSSSHPVATTFAIFDECVISSLYLS